MNPLSYSANKLLTIPADQPEYIYSGETEALLKAEYRALAAVWHPDRNINKLATNVFQHLKQLHDNAKKQLADGTWAGGRQVLFQDTKTGKQYKLAWLVKREFDLGLCYIAREHIAWCIKHEYADLAERGIKTIEKLSYSSRAMEEEFKKWMPQVHQVLRTKEYVVVLMKKRKDFYSLADIKNAHHPFDSRHAAWVVSGLLNLCCYLQYAGVAHGAITDDSVFINPTTHEVALFGGWWFAHQQGEKLTVLCSQAVDVAGYDIITHKKASLRLNGDMVHHVALELKAEGLALPMQQWMNIASGENAFKNYSIWMDKVLKDSFGKRKFIELKLAETDIYQRLPITTH